MQPPAVPVLALARCSKGVSAAFRRALYAEDLVGWVVQEPLDDCGASELDGG
jgi:hypothetical protein